MSTLNDKEIEYRNSKGNLHREDGPAYIEYDGTEHWFYDGKGIEKTALLSQHGMVGKGGIDTEGSIGRMVRL